MERMTRPRLCAQMIVACALLVVAGCGGSRAAGAESARPGPPVAASSRAATDSARAEATRATAETADTADDRAREPFESELEEEIDPTELEEALVIEGEMTVAVDEVDEAAEALRARAEEAGGRVMSDTRSRDEFSSSGIFPDHRGPVEKAELRLRVPPEGVDELVTWIEDLGELEHRHIEAEDVSRELFDRAIAIENLELTLERLRALLDREDVDMEQVLAIESEMTRVRGEIEELKGEQRWLRDRVALATLEVTLGAKAEIDDDDDAELDPEARMYPGVRGGALVLLDPDQGSRVRPGAGVVIYPFLPGGDDEVRGRISIEADAFHGADDDRPSLLFTAGGEIYSQFMGDGQRRFLNPYLGGRLGYGYVDRHALAFAATAGVELVKTRYALFDVNVRALGLAGRGGFDPGVVTAGSFVFAF